MEVTQKLRDVVEAPTSVDQSCHSVEYRLQPAILLSWQAGKRRIAVVQSVKYQRHNQRLYVFTNRKWHMCFRLVQRAVTLNDLEPRIRDVQHCAAISATAELVL